MKNMFPAPGSSARKWISTPKGLADLLPVFILASVALITITPSPSHSYDEESSFYIRASAGYSRPWLEDLSGELETQGEENIGSGLGLSVSLGRSIFDDYWMAEINFSASFYQSFYYLNEYEDFKGSLSHQHYAIIIRRTFSEADTRFRPFAGAGVGYGITKLISGGGKLSAFEWEALLGLEVKLRENLSIMLEAEHISSFTGERYDSPYLENVNEDVIYDNNGLPLEDKYSSLDLRLGIVVRQSGK